MKNSTIIFLLAGVAFLLLCRNMLNNADSYTPVSYLPDDGARFSADTAETPVDPEPTPETDPESVPEPTPEPESTPAPLPAEAAPPSPAEEPPAAEPPPAPQPEPARNAPTPEAESIPTFATAEQAFAYLREALAACPETIRVRIGTGFDKSLTNRGASVINEQWGLFCYQAEMQNDLLTFSVQYDDETLILAAHQGKLPPSRLTPLQQTLYQKARAIVREAEANTQDDYELARALHDWIGLHCRYVKAIKPEGPLASVLLYGEGLCECYARTYLLLTRLAGLDCLFVSGESAGTGHAWNIIKLKGTWVHVDCTHDDPLPDTPGKVNHIYFGMGDATIRQDHSWEQGKYPRCPTNALWYAYNNTPHFASLDDMAAALIRQADRQGGSASLDGYVRELVDHPDAARKLLREAVEKYHRSMGVVLPGENSVPGFITLTTGNPDD